MNIKPTRTAGLAAGLLAVILSIGAAAQDALQPLLPTVRLTAGGMHVIQAEVAAP